MVGLLRVKHSAGNVVSHKVKAVGSSTRWLGCWADRRSATLHIQVTGRAEVGPSELDVDGAAAGEGVAEEVELLQGLICHAGIAGAHVERSVVSQVLIVILLRLRVEAD